MGEPPIFLVVIDGLNLVICVVAGPVITCLHVSSKTKKKEEVAR